jgi:hypothetical protein
MYLEMDVSHPTASVGAFLLNTTHAMSTPVTGVESLELAEAITNDKYVNPKAIHFLISPLHMLASSTNV